MTGWGSAKMTCSSERENIRELLPRYVCGDLGEDERCRVEEACAADPMLAAELADWRAVREGYAALESELPEPPPFLYTRIRERVRVSPGEKVLTRLLGNRRFALGVIGAELAVILLLVFVATGREARYRTLSAGGVETSARHEVRLNVVFRDDTREREIRSLLRSIDGRIVDGPVAGTSLFVVALPLGGDPDAVIRQLKESGKITFAERAY